MKLALEIPKAYFDVFYPLADFDFLLADYVLKNKAYLNQYNRQTPRRLRWLDNSYYELGKSVDLLDL